MKKESILIQSDGTSLHGLISWPDCDASCSVLLLHPHPLYGGDMNNYVIAELEGVFNDLKYATLRFNFRGVSGRYAGVQGAVEDAMKALVYLDHKDMHITGLIGYSFGGSIALRVASAKSLDFIVTLSASMDLFREDGVEISLLSRVKCPVLLFHGLFDTMVPYADMQRFSAALLKAKTVTLEDETHFYESSLFKVRKEIQSFIAEL